MPSVVGIYLAAGWGLLEFTDWATGRFGLTESLETALVVTWAVCVAPLGYAPAGAMLEKV